MGRVVMDLIKSLTTSEKVYFKRQARTHDQKSTKNYLQIYEVVEKMETYNKETFAASFRGTAFEKHLSSELDYLKEKILISLFNFNLNRSKRNKIQKGILIAEELANKGFRKEALKKLNFIKKSAFRQEEFMWILRLIELEEIILFREGAIGYKDKLGELREQRNRVTSMIQNLNNYHILREEIREFQFSENLNMNNVKAFTDLCSDELVKDSHRCMSTRAKEHWFYFQVLMNYLKWDFEAGLSISSDYVDFMFEHHHLFGINKLLPALSNYFYHAALCKNKPHFDLGQSMLQQLEGNKSISQQYLNYILYTRNLEFAYYAQDADLMREYQSKAIALLEQESAHLEESQIQYLLMTIVRATIVLEDQKRAMQYSNHWMQRGVLPFRKVQARLFSIMIHYELGYLELVLSEIILLKKSEKRNQREKRLINAFYSFLNKRINKPERKKDLLHKFQQELAAISGENRGYFDFISFDYHWWSLRLD